MVSIVVYDDDMDGGYDYIGMIIFNLNNVFGFNSGNMVYI